MQSHRSNRAHGASRPWQDGEIAFLKSCDYFQPKDHRNLIASGYLHPKATSHPVIILEAIASCAIVTTVTAFNSGPHNKFFPPWRMLAHQEKHLDDYYAFIGTELPRNSRNTHLKLSDSGAKMNKPQASWVYIKNFFTVPYTVLLPWDKVPQQLRVSEESLAQLRADIERKYSFQLQSARSRLTAIPQAAKHAPARGIPQAPRYPRAQQWHPKPQQPQRGTAKPPTDITRYSAFVPQHSTYQRYGAYNQPTTQSTLHRAISTTGAFIHPAMMHSWHQPIKT